MVLTSIVFLFSVRKSDAVDRMRVWTSTIVSYLHLWYVYFHCSAAWWFGMTCSCFVIRCGVACSSISASRTYTHNHFTTLFPGPPGWADARRELLDFMVQGKINRGRHNDHPAGRHSVWTNQCQPPTIPHFLQAGCPSCRPTNSVKALKATSAFGLGRRR